MSRARLRGHPIVGSSALCSDNAKQDPVVYGAEFEVVLLMEDPSTTYILYGLDCLGLYHPSLEEERHFRPTVELT